MEDMKKYILMHKRLPVTVVDIDEATGSIVSAGDIYDEGHIPPGITVMNGRADRKALNAWWRGRAIPASRDGIKNALIELDVSEPQLLIEKCLGLSLSDQYWICPEGSDIKWDDVNFFENDFSDDVGNILFGKGQSSKQISLMSPDNTSDGWLRKKWKIIDGKRCLIKGGSGALQQEPYNEVIASEIMDRLGIPHAAYRLISEDGYPFSVCEDFITPDTELISAWHVMQTVKKPNHVSLYQHYRDCCSRMGVPGITAALDHMIVLDYIIANEDRHQNNFGVIRDAETLDYKGAAPIYDSGTSLWYDKPLAMIGDEQKLKCKPFKNSHEEQLELVGSFEWVDFARLSDIDEEAKEVMRDSLFIDEARCDAICRSLGKRVKSLRDYVKKKNE